MPWAIYIEGLLADEEPAREPEKRNPFLSSLAITPQVTETHGFAGIGGTAKSG